MHGPLSKIAALAAVVGLVLAGVGPVAAASHSAGNDALSGAGNQSLAIGVQQGAGSATVVVTNNSTAVENATVTVTANTSYNGTGTYQTDETGSVSLPLPGPNETVRVDITAEKDGLTGETTAVLHGNAGEGPPFVPPGQRIAAFVHALQSIDGVNHFGLSVSSYVHGIVPSGHAGADASPPAWVSAAGNNGPPDHVTQRTDRGPPASVTDDGDEPERGPPEHAKPGGPHDDEDEDEDDDDGPGQQGKGNGPPK